MIWHRNFIKFGRTRRMTVFKIFFVFQQTKKNFVTGFIPPPQGLAWTRNTQRIAGKREVLIRRRTFSNNGKPIDVNERFSVEPCCRMHVCPVRAYSCARIRNRNIRDRCQISYMRFTVATIKRLHSSTRDLVVVVVVMVMVVIVIVVSCSSLLLVSHFVRLRSRFSNDLHFFVRGQRWRLRARCVPFCLYQRHATRQDKTPTKHVQIPLNCWGYWATAKQTTDTI